MVFITTSIATTATSPSSPRCRCCCYSSFPFWGKSQPQSISSVVRLRGSFNFDFAPGNKYKTYNNNNDNNKRSLTPRRGTSPSPSSCRANLITNPDSFQVGKLIGTYGFINITSYSTGALDFENSFQASDRLRIQDVGQGTVNIRLYEGRIVQGPRRGTPIIFKVYPGKQVGGADADMMAANELNAHALLQSSSKTICQNIQLLLGGFETKTGEQWLAFRYDGKFSAADYAKGSSEKLSKNRAFGEQRFWNPFEEEVSMKRKRFFIVKLLHGALSGLAYMHGNDRLHQSLGPASIVLNTMFEKEADYLIPRLRDLAFSVDIRYSSLGETSGTLSEGLWRRATAAGAFSAMEKRAFGIADDIYEAGLLLAYLAFIPFSEPGTFDSLSLQRLLESTFKLDLEATRETIMLHCDRNHFTKVLFS